MEHEINHLIDEMVAWIAERRAEANKAPSMSQKNELLQKLREVDHVMRQAYPDPVNPNPSGSGKKKCPHCGKDIP